MTNQRIDAAAPRFDAPGILEGTDRTQGMPAPEADVAAFEQAMEAGTAKLPVQKDVPQSAKEQLPQTGEPPKKAGSPDASGDADDAVQGGATDRADKRAADMQRAPADEVEAMFRAAELAAQPPHRAGEAASTAGMSAADSMTPPGGGTAPGDLDALVSRILVNAPAEGDAEVRIFLQTSAFPDTEIRIARDVLGRLAVHVAAGDPQAFQTLVASRADLVEALRRTEQTEPDVVIGRGRTDADEGAREDAAGRRSKGLDGLDGS